jgi:exopolysaccharide biosynthesis polyprenyl glycosylphosphotransferase
MPRARPSPCKTRLIGATVNDIAVPRPAPKIASVLPRLLGSAAPPVPIAPIFASTARPLRRTWARRYRARLRITDFAVTSTSVLAALVIGNRIAPVEFPANAATLNVAIALAVLLFWSIGLSAFRTRDLTIVGLGPDEYRRVAHASTTVFGLAAILFLVGNVEAPRWFLIVTLPLGVTGLVTSRWLWRKWLHAQRLDGHALSRVVVVGRRHDVARVASQLARHSGDVYSVVGAVVDGNSATSAPIPELPAIGYDLAQTTTFAASVGADAIIVAGQPDSESEFIRDLAWDLEGKSMALILATSLANVTGPRIRFRPVDGLPMLHVEIPQFEGGKHVLKRAFDLVGAAAAIILLAPVAAVIALTVRADSAGSAIFRQERVGRSGKTFVMLKFRSMVVDAVDLLPGLKHRNQGNGVLFKIRDDPRVTRVGRILRKYSLDELPQLWNVLMGNMSLVGPRPPLPEEVLEYHDHVHRRLYIRPGLTGMWQINGRSTLSWEDSVRLDLYYVENWSLVGDLMIIWRTVKMLVRPVGAY